MSLKTWLAEYYPVPAGEVPKERAAEASLLKWEGLRKENLSKHGLMVGTGGHVYTKNIYPSSKFEVGSCTCSLCFHHLENYCRQCPLALVRGGVRCDIDRDDEKYYSPWEHWNHQRNPEPMIKWLVEAADWEATHPTKEGETK